MNIKTVPSDRQIIIGIDATNIRHGGGITHLSRLMKYADPNLSGISKVIVWASNKTLEQLPNKPWLHKKSNSFLEGNFFHRLYWQMFVLQSQLKKYTCNLLFVPGGSFTVKFRPVVSMNQNLLPFEWKEILRYKFSLMTLKWILLRFTQSMSFQKSNGIIFLSQYSRNVVLKSLKRNNAETTIIAHGVEKKFFKKPKKQYSINHYSVNNPFRIIYVSSVDFYKHQWNVVEAVSRIQKSGYPVTLDLYGSGNKKALKILKRTISELDKSNIFVRYHNEIEYSEIEQKYFSADLSIFASSCETFGQIVVESMATGLPIACSNMSTMPELLGECAVYFNPLDIDDIEITIRQLIDSKDQREYIANKAYEHASDFSWDETALKTFNFLKEVLE